MTTTRQTIHHTPPLPWSEVQGGELTTVEGGGWEDILGAVSAPLSNVLKAVNDLSQTIAQNLR